MFFIPKLRIIFHSYNIERFFIFLTRPLASVGSVVQYDILLFASMFHLMGLRFCRAIAFLPDVIIKRRVPLYYCAPSLLFGSGFRYCSK